jgi:hypothetical protein
VLRRRSSLVIDDLPADDIHKHMQHEEPSISEEMETNGVNGTDKPDGDLDKKEEKKPPPTQFKEPDANSLLDAFGF